MLAAMEFSTRSAKGAPAQYEGLAKALKSLNDDERGVLLLRSMQNMKYQEISDTLNMPIGSVMAYLSRARQKMRLMLQRQGWPGKERQL